MTELINNKEETFDKSGWVVLITSSNSHYVGKPVVSMVKDGEKTMTLSPGFNWINESVMAGPGQMMIMRQPTPLGPTLESSVITIDYIGIQYIDHWDEDTKEEFFHHIENLMKGMEQQRRRRSLEKSNLVIAQPGVNPNILRDLMSKK